MAISSQPSQTAKSSSLQQKQNTLQRTLTSALNELGIDNAVMAVQEHEGGPLVLQLAKGFSPRETQAILRSLSTEEIRTHTATEKYGEQETAIRLRLIIPGAKSLLAIPLTYRQRNYGMLVVGRKEGTSFTKKEKSLFENASEQISTSLEKTSLFDEGFLLGRPWITSEPPDSESRGEALPTPLSLATPEIQTVLAPLFTEVLELVTFDRAWITSYDPVAGTVEVIGFGGNQPSDPKKSLKSGQRLELDESASGWVIRHRKPRIDHDLASTQGRFFDHKPLFKDRVLSCMVTPFFVRGQVGGTLTLASKAEGMYGLEEARLLEPVLFKLGELLQEARIPRIVQAQEGSSEKVPPPPPVVHGSVEPVIRKQERQAALRELSTFLATEVREPLASIRAQMEEVTGEGILDFDPQIRVESAMRDLIRVESVLNEILDFAKPLELKRRLCRIQDIIDHALTLISTDLESTRISVVKEYPAHLNQVRCDDGKLQSVFLSIIKNAVEAMSPGGHLTIHLSQHKAGRSQEIEISIKNDGVPIPAELVDKVFEPYFTTKRGGTGLGLATVKKIVEEHQGKISISSGQDIGTTVTLQLPASSRQPPQRYRGRGRRPRRPR